MEQPQDERLRDAKNVWDKQTQLLLSFGSESSITFTTSTIFHDAHVRAYAGQHRLQDSLTSQPGKGIWCEEAESSNGRIPLYGHKSPTSRCFSRARGGVEPRWIVREEPQNNWRELNICLGKLSILGILFMIFLCRGRAQNTTEREPAGRLDFTWQTCGWGNSLNYLLCLFPRSKWPLQPGGVFACCCASSSSRFRPINTPWGGRGSGVVDPGRQISRKRCLIPHGTLVVAFKRDEAFRTGSKLQSISEYLCNDVLSSS